MKPKPEAVRKCDHEDDVTDQISVAKVGGAIMVLVGILMILLDFATSMATALGWIDTAIDATQKGAITVTVGAVLYAGEVMGLVDVISGFFRR